MNPFRSDLLSWPKEIAAASGGLDWHQAQSNLCLDFHGDPVRARLVVFSDGNHHMALCECVGRFLSAHPGAVDVFYATTPPGVLLNITQNGSLRLGNLSLSRQPHVFVGPEELLKRLHAEQRIATPRTFARSRGNVLLVRKGNPLNIRSAADLLRDDVRPFMSNPLNETASYRVYLDSLCNLGDEVQRAAFERRFAADSETVCFGERIHHRELPQALASGRADAAVVYFHLALRYTRIFSQLFEWLAFGGRPQDDAVEPGMTVTRYAVAAMPEPGEFGEAFAAYLLTREAADIYSSHGLTAPV